MNTKTKGIIIDFVILMIYGFLLMVGIYFLYEVFPNLSRMIAMLILFINISICWGTIILSIMGRIHWVIDLLRKRSNLWLLLFCFIF